MFKGKVLVIVAAVYCGCLVVSNVIAGKTFGILDVSLPCAVVIFPVVYILNDVLTEVFGFKTARTVIFTGFVVNVIAVCAYAATIALPPSAFFANQDAFTAVLGNTPRILLASFTAYIIGSIINAKVMQLLHDKDGEHHLMRRCVLSTAAGETMDASIFITIGFAGTMPIESLLVMVAAQAAFKTVYEIVVYPLTKMIIAKIKSLPEGSTLAVA